MFPILFFIVIIAIVILYSKRPSNERHWSPDQAVLPHAEMNGNIIKVRNIRNFTYDTPHRYEVDYYDRIFDTNKLTSVYYILVPFLYGGAVAHTFLSFGFEDNTHLSVSVEIRKKIGETFSPLKSLFRGHEIMYVIADENDVVKLRTHHRKDEVYIYPLRTDKEGVKRLFIDIMDRTNALRDKPEFYNTITNTCATNIIQHMNKVFPQKIPLSYKFLLTGRSDKLLYDAGLIDTTLPFERIREKFWVNDKARKYEHRPDFSAKIREDFEAT